MLLTSKNTGPRNHKTDKLIPVRVNAQAAVYRRGCIDLRRQDNDGTYWYKSMICRKRVVGIESNRCAAYVLQTAGDVSLRIRV